MKQIKAVQEKTNKTEKSDKADKTEDNCGIISSCVIQNDFELWEEKKNGTSCKTKYLFR